MFSEIFLQAIASATATVLGLTELVKRMLHIQGVGVVILSVLLSFAVTLPVLSAEGVVYWLTFSGFTALSANGVFKAVHRS